MVEPQDNLPHRPGSARAQVDILAVPADRQRPAGSAVSKFWPVVCSLLCVLLFGETDTVQAIEPVPDPALGAYLPLPGTGLREGMSIATVRSILGPPLSSGQTTDHGYTRLALRYHLGGYCVDLIFYGNVNGNPLLRHCNHYSW